MEFSSVCFQVSFPKFWGFGYFRFYIFRFRMLGVRLFYEWESWQGDLEPTASAPSFIDAGP